MDGSRVLIQPAPSKNVFTEEQYLKIIEYAKSNKDREYSPIEGFSKRFEDKSDRTVIALLLAKLSFRPDINDWRSIFSDVKDKEKLFAELTKTTTSNPLLSRYWAASLDNSLLMRYSYVLCKDYKCNCEKACGAKDHWISKHMVPEEQFDT